MKIFNANQTRELDAYTISNEPISSIDLMERASHAFVRCFCDRFVNTRPVGVFCGKGNNGGDGLAIARMLSERSFDVQVFIIEYTTDESDDFKQNLIRLKTHLVPIFIKSSSDIPPIPESMVLIDALLGSGLSRPVRGLLVDIIAALNALPSKVISVDIASGLFTNKANEDTDVIVQPDVTISFQLPKLAFMMPKNVPFVGEWHTLDIGLSPTRINETETPYFYTDKDAAEKLIRPRGKYAHKGTFGHALLMAGSYGKMGAALLAAKSCLRAGVGLLSMHIPECGYVIAQTAVPEAMVLTDQSQKYLSNLQDLEPYSAIGIGPGIGKEPATAEMVKALLKTVEVPLVIDADALNLLSENPELLSLLPTNTILTPHPREFERLAGKSKDEYERLELAITFAQKHQVIICLKGANTAVVLPNGQVHFNSTGNPGMATGGTGDVLTGVITGLLAQKYSPSEAAIMGVYQHGLAGDRAANKKGQSALIASDVVDCLGW